MDDYLIEKYNNIDVFYKFHLNGGGSLFGQDYIPLFKSLQIPEVDRIFEWCSGPGFIGFSLLSNGFCKSLCLADINPEAIDACNKTISTNNLDNISVYLSDNLNSIPAHEKWDIVVSNPPHWLDIWDMIPESDKEDVIKYGTEKIIKLLSEDTSWNIHKNFYNKLAEFLKDDGVAIIQEHTKASNPSDFSEMINASGLKIVSVLNSSDNFIKMDDNYYFLFVKKNNDCYPEWLKGVK